MKIPKRKHIIVALVVGITVIVGSVAVPSLLKTAADEVAEEPVVDEAAEAEPDAEADEAPEAEGDNPAADEPSASEPGE